MKKLRKKKVEESIEGLVASEVSSDSISSSDDDVSEGNVFGMLMEEKVSSKKDGAKIGKREHSKFQGSRKDVSDLELKRKKLESIDFWVFFN